MRSHVKSLAARARHCPLSAGVYRLYRGQRLLHVGMAAGAATLRSEVIAHARGEYGAATRLANRVQWEVAPDALFAYRRFLSVYNAATYSASGRVARRSGAPTRSRRHSRPFPSARARLAAVAARPR